MSRELDSIYNTIADYYRETDLARERDPRPHREAMRATVNGIRAEARRERQTLELQQHERAGTPLWAIGVAAEAGRGR